MASILDNKQKVYGNIAAAKTINDGLPNLKTSSSIPSVNNSGDSIAFLTDLIKSLIGFDVLVTTVVDILTHSLTDIEREIKIALKTELKGIVSCGVDPSLPAFIQSTGNGIVIEVNKVDFMDLFKVDPTSTGGQLLYNDVTSPLTNSSDFNTFLYAVIQDDGNTHTWKNILDITFNSIGTGGKPNNTFTIKATSAYTSKTLTDLNNDFVDSLTLFNAQGILSRIVDLIFGSISVSVNKTKKQLENEAKINNVVDCMVNSDEGDTIDDNYFKFTNEEVYVHQDSANNRQRGIVKLDCCNQITASIPVTMLTDMHQQFSAATTSQQQHDVIATSINNMAAQNTANSQNPSDNTTIKLNFVQNIINNLIKAIVGVVLSPKVAMIFLINYKIVYGPSSTFDGGVDFIQKNKNLLQSIMKKISGMIIKILVTIALKEIAALVAGVAVKRQIEKGKNQLSQILSLVGVSQDIIRMIKGLT